MSDCLSTVTYFSFINILTSTTYKKIIWKGHLQGALGRQTTSHQCRTASNHCHDLSTWLQSERDATGWTFMCILYKCSPPCDHAVRNMWYGGSQRCTLTNYVLYAHHRMFTPISSSVCIICLKKDCVVTTAYSVCGSLPTSKPPKEQAYAQLEDGKGSSCFVACRTWNPQIGWRVDESWRCHSSTINNIYLRIPRQGDTFFIQRLHHVYHVWTCIRKI